MNGVKRMALKCPLHSAAGGAPLPQLTPLYCHPYLPGIPAVTSDGGFASSLAFSGESLPSGLSASEVLCYHLSS